MTAAVSNTSIYADDHEHCDLPPDQHDGCETIRLVKKVIFSVSISMDIIALFVLILYRKYTSFSQRIFLNILLCNLVEGAAHLLDDGITSPKCTIAAFLIQTAGFALFMWVGALTLFLFLLLMKKKNTKHYEKHYWVACYGIPIITGIVPLFTRSYGPAGAFCWVELDELRLAIWWVPVPIGMILIMTAYIIMICKATICKKHSIPEAQQRTNKKMVAKYLWPLAGYGVMFVALHILMLVERITTYGGMAPIYEMKLLHIISISSYGTILCTLFYVTNGKAGLSKKKLRVALAAHRRDLTCRRQQAVVRTMTVKPDTDSESSAEEVGVGNQVHTNVNVAVISGATGGNNKQQQQLNLEYKSGTKSVKPESTKKKSKSSKTTNNSLTLTIQSFSEAKYLDPKYLKSHSTKKSKHTSGIQDGDSEGFELNELDEPRELDETMATHHLRPVDVEKEREKQLLQIQSLNLKPSISYKLDRKSEMLKLYFIEENKLRWDVWKDDTTLESWVRGLQSTLQRNVMVMVHDQDGAYFGEHITWGQIKSCANRIRIIINQGATEIKFTPKYDEKNNSTEDSPTMYETASCV